MKKVLSRVIKNKNDLARYGHNVETGAQDRAYEADRERLSKSGRPAGSEFRPSGAATTAEYITNVVKPSAEMLARGNDGTIGGNSKKVYTEKTPAAEVEKDIIRQDAKSGTKALARRVAAVSLAGVAAWGIGDTLNNPSKASIPPVTSTEQGHQPQNPTSELQVNPPAEAPTSAPLGITEVPTLPHPTEHNK